MKLNPSPDQLAATLRRLNLRQQSRNVFVNITPGQLRAASIREFQTSSPLTRSNLHPIIPTTQN